MSHRTIRRDFMLSTLARAAGVAALFSANTRAIEPITRGGGYSFKLSLAAYSYRHLLQDNPPQLSLVDFIDDCAQLGLAGAELASYYLPKNPTTEYLRQLKGEVFRRGLEISGIAIGNDFCFPPSERRDKEITHVKRWIEYADLIDAPVIRIFAGDAKPGQPPEEAHRLAVDSIEECCQYAGKYGVFLALENHGGITGRVDNMLAVVRDVQSPWFGVSMDTGNFNSADVYGDLAKLAPFSVNVEVKVHIRPVGQAPEPTDFTRLANILRTSDYRGYIVLKFEESRDARAECRRQIVEMRKAFRTC